MDIKDTPQEAAFRLDVQTWLRQNATPKIKVHNLESATTPENLAKAKAFQALKAKAGFAGITWPKAFGGRGGTPIESVIYAQEEAHYESLAEVFGIGLGMVLPTVLKHAQAGIAERYAAKALSGEHIWCQLFSEPAAGSDVAAIRTKAVQTGEDWVINGQKVWTTGAQVSDYGILLTRTNPDVPKHAGLTMFIVDMKAKGVDVRPIKQLSGESEFNEVFFTDVMIADDHRLGEVGEGWKVSLTTLMNERLSVGSTQLDPTIEDLISLAKTTRVNGKPALQNDAVRAKIADWYSDRQGLTNRYYRTITALSKGELPGPENAIGKIITGKQMQDVSSLAMELMGDEGALREDNPFNGAFQRQWMWAAGLRIAGGTDEILRNIIAERVLGLPPDVRVDKDKSFREMEG